MPAKKKETAKKRIQPVVEVVEEEVVEPTTPKVKKTDGASLEPDFSSKVSESVGEGEDQIATEDAETEEVVEEVVVEEVPEEAEKTEEPQVEEVVEEVVVEEPAEEAPTEEVVEEVVVEQATPPVSSPTPAAKPAKEERHEHKMSIKTILVITIISALVAAFVSGGVYVYLNGVNELRSSIDDMASEQDTEDEADDETETEDEATPEPTEAPAVSEDLTIYSIEVLNGSGEIGAAGRASDVLEDGGFVVEDTGNADSYDFTDTVVQYKVGTPEADVNALVKALEVEYEVELSDDTLDEDSEYDFIVTVGTD